MPGMPCGLETSIATAAEETVVSGNEGLESGLVRACNESQAAAVAAAASCRLTLVHGPPGTGKVRPSALVEFYVMDLKP